MAKDIWLISDTHFGHENILKFTDKHGDPTRPFTSVSEMDEEMIERWNSRVKENDKVYHLGDVALGGGKARIKEIFSRLNGRKRLILGNHDNGKNQDLQKVFEKIDLWRNFSEFGLLLTHVPVHESTLRENRFGKPMINVHGHIHQNESPKGPYRCVCVEHIDYAPIHIEEVLKSHD